VQGIRPIDRMVHSLSIFEDSDSFAILHCVRKAIR
jgi:hypothetical protein